MRICQIISTSRSLMRKDSLSARKILSLGSMTLNLSFMTYIVIFAKLGETVSMKVTYRIMRQRASSSCRTLSMYIMSRSLTMAPLIIMISSLFIMPADEKKVIYNIKYL